MFAIYGALASRYWFIWSYTVLMYALGACGALSELTRGCVSAWLGPMACGIGAFVLTHQIAIRRKQI